MQSNRDQTYPCFVCQPGPSRPDNLVRFYAGLNPEENMANLLPYDPGLMGMSLKDLKAQWENRRPVEYRVICNECSRKMEGQGIPVLHVHYSMLKEERLT